MSEENQTYQKGDWIVHCSYGVAHILGTETRDISGEETLYYHLKLEALNSHIWIPVDKLAEDVRPLTDPEEFEEALAILDRPPRPMSSQFSTRTKRIATVRSQNSPTALARLLRDLRARQKKRGALSQTEQGALRRITQRFLAEWAACMDVELEVVEQKLNQRLKRGRQQAAMTD